MWWTILLFGEGERDFSFTKWNQGSNYFINPPIAMEREKSSHMYGMKDANIFLHHLLAHTNLKNCSKQEKYIKKIHHQHSCVTSVWIVAAITATVQCTVKMCTPKFSMNVYTFCIHKALQKLCTTTACVCTSKKLRSRL